MRHDVAERWVKALRSGEYEQGRGVLRDHNNRYCCLGVLCDLYAKEKGKDWTLNPDRGAGYGSLYSIHHATGILPFEVMEWADIKTEEGLLPEAYPRASRTLPTLGAARDLTGLNDSGYTFTAIADLVELHKDAI